jgi:hypothetical protein
LFIDVTNVTGFTVPITGEIRTPVRVSKAVVFTVPVGRLDRLP